MKTPVYLDYNATTPLDPRVFDYMKPFMLEKFGNASSTHSYGFEAASAVKTARETIAHSLGANSNEIYFTSGATESINIAHFGIAKAYSSKGKRIITSSIEHSASYDSLNYLEQKGFEIIYLQVNKDGFISPDDLRNAINNETILVSIMTANNEIGTIQDLNTISSICNEYNVLFHTDAAQAIGKINFDLNEIKADIVSLSGHKLYGPKGIGALFIRNKNPKIKLTPMLYGGGHENNLRPGTLNVPAIAGLGKALQICLAEMPDESERIRTLRDRLYEGILRNLDGVYLNGPLDNRLYNNLNLTFEGVRAETLLSSLRDIAVSTGAACSSASLKPSRVLKAIGLPDDLAKSSVRISLGRFTTGEEVDYTINRITTRVKELRESSPSFKLKKELTTGKE